MNDAVKAEQVANPLEIKMNDAVKAEQVANPLEINKERLRQWEACASGTRWFLEFPQGKCSARFITPCARIAAIRMAIGWSRRVFSQLDAGAKAVQLVSITGADKAVKYRAAGERLWRPGR